MEKIKKYYSEKQLKRLKRAVEKYKLGWTFENIGKEFKVVRERARQIVMKGLEYEARNNFKQYREIDIEKHIKREKDKHLLKIKKSSKKNKKREIILEEKKWSMAYEHCRKCGTTKIKHRSNGYCKWCYPKSEIFKKLVKDSYLRNKRKRKIKQKEYAKEYSKRPEVIEKRKRQNDIDNFDGNREKAMIRDNYTCQVCSTTQKESLEKIGRDLYVVHINDTKNNNLDNLMTACKRCYNKKVVKIMREGRKTIKFK